MTTVIDDTQFKRNLIKFVAPSTAVAASLWWDQTTEDNGGCMTIFSDQAAPYGVASTCHTPALPPVAIQIFGRRAELCTSRLAACSKRRREGVAFCYRANQPFALIWQA